MPFNVTMANAPPYNCPMDDVSSCTNAFTLWRDDAIDYSIANPTEAVNLTLPSGHTYNLSSNVPAGGTHRRDVGGGIYLADQVKNLTITATGSTITDDGGAGYMMGMVTGDSADFHGTDAYFAKTATVNAGSSTVQLLTPAQVSLFTVGSYALMTGLDIQGYGQPINLHFFEYVIITAIDSNVVSPTYGQITFSLPLENTYKSTWPQFSPGSRYGGPAALYQMDPAWDTTVTYIGGTWARTAGGGTPTQCICRHATFIDTISTFQIGPSLNHTFEVIGGNWGSALNTEMDKMTELCIYDNAIINHLGFQSSSCKRAIFKNGTTVNNMEGTPRFLEMQPGTSITTLSFGCTAYGASDQIIADGAVLPYASVASVVDDAGGAGVNNSADWSMTNGVIRYSNPGGYFPVRWAVPGYYCLWELAPAGPGSRRYGIFQVLDVTFDGNYTYVTTDQSGGFPNFSGAALAIRSHPAPNCQVTSCTGTTGTQLSAAGAFDRPWNSYWTGTFSQTTIGDSGSPTYAPFQWGNLTKMTVAVNSAYAGTNLTATYGPEGYTLNFPVIDKNNNLTIYPIEINVRTQGTRIATPTTTTGTVTGDNNVGYTSLAPMWMTGEAGAGIVSGVVTDSALSVMVEVITDQGIEEEPTTTDAGVAIRTISYGAAKFTTRPTKIPQV